MTETPITLLERLRQQPHEGCHWERFVRLFTPILSRWATRLGVAPTDIDDLLQETFVLLIGKLVAFEYDPQRSFRAWLWTVFRHHFLAWRKKHTGPLRQSDFDIEQLASPDDGNALLVEAEYRQQLLDRALTLIRVDFPEQTWQLFWQSVVEGRPVLELATAFEVTPNAIYLVRRRVLARLRQELAGFDQ